MLLISFDPVAPSKAAAMLETFRPVLNEVVFGSGMVVPAVRCRSCAVVRVVGGADFVVVVTLDKDVPDGLVTASGPSLIKAESAVTPLGIIETCIRAYLRGRIWTSPNTSFKGTVLLRVTLGCAIYVVSGSIRDYSIDVIKRVLSDFLMDAISLYDLSMVTTGKKVGKNQEPA